MEKAICFLWDMYNSNTACLNTAAYAIGRGMNKGHDTFKMWTSTCDDSGREP